MNFPAASTSELEVLWSELQKARQEAEQQKAAAEQASEQLTKEKEAASKHAARVVEVEEDLKGLYVQCDTLQDGQKKKAAELEKLGLACKEAQTQARAAREELQQVKQIAASKPYLLNSVFGGIRFAQLMQIWCSSDAFMDLPRSASDACHYYGSCEGDAEQKAF